ncbi:hypothetical protein Dimus_009169 [Dionaea muscipula]
MKLIGFRLKRGNETLPGAHLFIRSRISSKSAQRVLSRAMSALGGDPTFIHSEGRCAAELDFNLVARLHGPGSTCNPYRINQLISLCARSGDLDAGVQLHCAVVKLGFVSNVYICSALVSMYGKCCRVDCAQKLFDEMPQRNAVSWNSLSFGYIQIRCPEVGVGLFLEMMQGGVSPTPFGISSVLVGCVQLEDAELGAQIQGLSIKYGFSWNSVVATGLVDMYAKCLKVKESRKVFDQMPERNLITWTAMVTGYAQNRLPFEAITVFREMRRLGFESNYVTYNSLLSSFCGSVNLNHCKQIHSQIIGQGLESNRYIQATLLSVYSDCDARKEDFHSICSGVSSWDQISVNAAIAGFSRLECSEEALNYFCTMRRNGLKADLFTLASILRAIGLITALEAGKQTHALVFKAGCASNVHVQNALVSMYTRCGLINEGKSVFTAMIQRDLVSWNSLLSGFAYHGYGQEVIRLFEQMRNMGIQPDKTTILSLLSACSHVGLLEKGLEYLQLLRGLDFYESLTPEHCASIVDLFGRAGHLQEAETFISSMPMQPGPSIYKSLISACKVHGNTEIAMRTTGRLLEMYPDDPGTYALLSSSLAKRGFWGEAAGVRKLMQGKGVQKKPGSSWIESDKAGLNLVKH